MPHPYRGKLYKNHLQYGTRHPEIGGLPFFQGQIRNLHGRFPNPAVFWRSKLHISVVLGPHSRRGAAKLTPPLWVGGGWGQKLLCESKRRSCRKGDQASPNFYIFLEVVNLDPQTAFSS